MKTERKLTEAALAAKAIREELKSAFPGVKFSVTSSNFSMGNSVHISYTDGPTSDQVEKITDKYQYGHFNGMEDIYEYTNSRDDIPQAKYVSVSRKMSDEAEKLIVKLHNNKFADSGQIALDENGEPLRNERNEGAGIWNSEVIYRAYRQYDFLAGGFVEGSDYGRIYQESPEAEAKTEPEPETDPEPDYPKLQKVQDDTEDPEGPEETPVKEPITIESEFNRRMDLINNEEFRKVCIDIAKDIGITATEWNDNKAVILLSMANKVCSLENQGAFDEK